MEIQDDRLGVLELQKLLKPEGAALHFLDPKRRGHVRGIRVGLIAGRRPRQEGNVIGTAAGVRNGSGGRRRRDFV